MPLLSSSLLAHLKLALYFLASLSMNLGDPSLGSDDVFGPFNEGPYLYKKNNEHLCLVARMSFRWRKVS
jgi:hypothetical protein